MNKKVNEIDRGCKDMFPKNLLTFFENQRFIIIN